MSASADNESGTNKCTAITIASIKSISLDSELALIKSGGGRLIHWDREIDKVAGLTLSGTLLFGGLGGLFSFLTHLATTGVWVPYFMAAGTFVCGAIISLVVFLAATIGDKGKPFAFHLRTREERQYLKAVKSYLKNKREELKELRRRTRQFNKALDAFQKAEGLLGEGMMDEVRTAAAESLGRQRDLLAEEVDGFWSEFRAAFTALQEKRELACKSAEEIRELEKRRKAFQNGVAALKRLYADLPGYDGGIFDNDNLTADVAPYTGVEQMRAKLEAECLELGISPNELPSPPKSVPRLPAKTTA